MLGVQPCQAGVLELSGISLVSYTQSECPLGQL